MTKFVPGKSGNPAGRPKGVQDRRTAARALFDARRHELVAKAIDLALAGDTVALKMCLDRAIPALKPQDAPITLPGFAGSIGEQGRQVLEALAQGRLTPDEAGTVMRAVAAQARIVEVEELERRVSKLEQARGNAEGKN
jgi:hypothetical protein